MHTITARRKELLHLSKRCYSRKEKNHEIEDYEKAFLRLEEVLQKLKKNPKDARLHFIIYHVYAELRCLNKAMEALEKAVLYCDKAEDKYYKMYNDELTKLKNTVKLLGDMPLKSNQIYDDQLLRCFHEKRKYSDPDGVAMRKETEAYLLREKKLKKVHWKRYQPTDERKKALTKHSSHRGISSPSSKEIDLMTCPKPLCHTNWLFEILYLLQKVNPVALLHSFRSNVVAADFDLYNFQFHSNGKKILVLVDGDIAMSPNHLSILSEYPKQDLWPLLLEKAYAKYKGGFPKLDRLEEDLPHTYIADALSELTGGITVTYDHKEDDLYYLLWKRYLYFWDIGSVVIAYTNSSFPGSRREYNGLLPNSPYAVLGCVEIKNEKFLKLRNMRYYDGTLNVVWTGVLSKDDTESWTKVMRNLLNPQDSEESEFFMTYDDFMEHFERTDMLHMFRDTDEQLIRDVVYRRTDAETPQFQLEVKENSKIFLSVEQPDNDCQFKFTIIKSPNLKKGEFTPLGDIEKDDYVIVSTQELWSNSRCVSFELTLKASDDNYLVALDCDPLTSKPVKFSIRVMSYTSGVKLIDTPIPQSYKRGNLFTRWMRAIF